MTVIYYDLETTDLSKTSQIVSIGAVTEHGATFHRYLIPTCPISPRASQIHDITLEDGLLHKNGVWKRKALGQREGLQTFMDWLESKDAQCLVAHNNLRFDSIILKNSMARFGVKRPRNGFSRWFFVDSLQLMRGKLLNYKWLHI